MSQPRAPDQQPVKIALPPPPPMLPTWTTQEIVDPMTDAKTLVASIDATDGEELLVARCSGKRAALAIITDQVLRDGGATIRIGASKAQQVRADVTASYKGVILRDPHEWFRRIKESPGETMLVQMNGYTGAIPILRFDLTGAGAAVDKIVERCGGWPPKIERDKSGKRVCNKPWPERCAWETGE